MSDSSVPITTWGPAVWSSMHALSFTYPHACEMQCEKRKNMFEFLKSLTSLVPCETCRQHYLEWWEANASSETSSMFNSREALSRALVGLHNEVNARIGKPFVSFKSVRDRFMTSSKTCPLMKRREILWVVLLGVVVVSLILLVILVRRVPPKQKKDNPK